MGNQFDTQAPVVALVEPFGEGHHPMYVAGYWKAFQSLGCRTLFVGPRRLAEDAEAAFPPGQCVISAASCISWDPVGEGVTQGLSVPDAAMALWRSLVATLGRERLDLAFLLSLDSFAPQSSPRLHGESVPWRFSGLWFRPPPAFPGTIREAVRRVLRRGRDFRTLRLSKCGPVLVLDDPGAIGHLGSYTSHGVLAAPEFSTYERSREPSSAVAETLRRVGGRRLVALVGSLEPRKGIREFLQAAAVADPSEWAFVLAGKLYRQEFDAETLRLLDNLAAGHAPRVLLQDGWMEATELNDIVARADLLFLCYDQWRFSTNMLCKTAFFRVPSLTCNTGYAGRMVQRYGLGVVVGRRSEVPGLFCGKGLGSQIESLRRSAEFETGCRDYLVMNSLSALGDVLPALFAHGPHEFTSRMRGLS